MRKKIALLFAASVAILMPALPASATPTIPDGGLPVQSSCLHADWYVNPDEADRLPTQTETGLEFDGADLVHRAIEKPLAELTPGTYVATPDPDQPSFFSVEVRNSAGAYGTLRWNLTGPDANKWTIVIGAGTGPDGAATDGTFTDANPVTLLTGKITKWGAFDAAPVKVISFGVGYTKNPPGTVKTIVTSVTFGGATYGLACQPEEEPSPDPTGTPTPSPSPSASETTAPPVAAGPSLPVTGSGFPWGLVIAGAVVLAVGVMLVFAGAKERHRIENS